MHCVKMEKVGELVVELAEVEVPVVELWNGRRSRSGNNCESSSGSSGHGKTLPSMSLNTATCMARKRLGSNYSSKVTAR